MPELSSLGNVKPTAAGGGQVRLDLDLADAGLLATIASAVQGLVALRVTAASGVSNAPGRVVVTATNPSTGTFVLTCAVGWRWHAAVGGGNNLTSVRTVTTEVDASDARKLNVAVFNNTGALASVGFYIVGLLVPS
ncbi:MAG: hypothetical protein M0R28_21575 [Pigmentiphaga sp.]|nr:hypothetical protein [Pigmentiphaga sp.]